MMDYPLTLHPILDRARRLFGRKQVVTGVGDGGTRATYAEVGDRVDRLASALRALGVAGGERVGTLCWNHQPHLELYFAAPSIGAVLHTINFRLFADQIAFIVNDAEDRVLFVDASVVAVVEPIAARLNSVRHFVVVGDCPDGLDELAGRPVHRYERLLADAAPLSEYPRLDEEAAAAMCYTSGTTGNPKGVVYSHRALVLHALITCMPDVLALSERDVVMPVVPMFHVNAWGLPFASTLVGATQVMPGVAPAPADLVRLIEQERVTMTAGVPTIWLGVLAELEAREHDVSSLKRIVCGGSAAPRAMMETYEKKYGVPVWHAWGMTEMSPIGSVCHLKSSLEDVPEDERWRIRSTQGTPMPLVEMRAIDDAGRDVPWDGQALGELIVRGPCVTAGYYNDPRARDRFTEDGWFRTGDVVTIDPEGYFEVADRSKDLVKSGGEWISSIALENALVAHPAVAEACVIAVPDPKWGERPLACVVPRPSAGDVTKDDLIDFLRPSFAKWWLPDDVVFLAELPRTGVGKLDKKVLRDRFRERAPAPRQD
ncbi:MAG: long-chain fatty acid--CoA ligase, partial [Chloroflexota bacterium]|nr:long-chain fatty acid--CoA ligase [Chloroflexota bacterium]